MRDVRREHELGNPVFETLSDTDEKVAHVRAQADEKVAHAHKPTREGRARVRADEKVAQVEDKKRSERSLRNKSGRSTPGTAPTGSKSPVTSWRREVIE